MAERRIEVQMAAVNAAETAAAIGQSTEAVKGLNEAQKENVEQTEDAATAGKQDVQIGLQRAQTYEKIGTNLKQVSQDMKAMADRIRDDAPEMAGELDAVADSVNSLGSAAAGAAQGFQMGGPFGAAVGAVVGAFVPSLKGAFGDMTQSLMGAEKSAKDLAESTKRLAEMKAAKESFDWAKQAAEDLNAAAAAAERLATGMTKVHQAKADLAEAEATLADQEAIDNGADPAKVEEGAIRRRAAAGKTKIDRELNAQRSIAEDATRRAQETMNPADIAEANRLRDKYGYDAAAGGFEKQKIDVNAQSSITKLRAPKNDDEANAQFWDKVADQQKLEEAAAAQKVVTAAKAMTDANIRAWNEIQATIEQSKRAAEVAAQRAKNSRNGK